MSLPTKMRPGDVILTEGAGWVSWGIRQSQRWILRNPVTGRRGYRLDGAWRNTHVGLVVEPDKVFEVTFPVSKFTKTNRFVRDARRWRVCRRQLGHGMATVDYPDAALGYMFDGAMTLAGIPYDAGDLVDFLIDGLYGPDADRKKYGFAQSWRVCSTGVAYVEEYARRAMMGELGEAFRDPAKVEPWPRAFGLRFGAYVHVEDVVPALYGLHSDYTVVENGRA